MEGEIPDCVFLFSVVWTAGAGVLRERLIYICGRSAKTRALEVMCRCDNPGFWAVRTVKFPRNKSFFGVAFAADLVVLRELIFKFIYGRTFPLRGDPICSIGRTMDEISVCYVVWRRRKKFCDRSSVSGGEYRYCTQ